MSLVNTYKKHLDDNGQATFRSCDMRKIVLSFKKGGGHYSYYECDAPSGTFQFNDVEDMISYIKECF